MGISRMAPGEQYVTAREIADRVGLSTDKILRYYRDGKIPGRRMPGQIRPVRFLWSEAEVGARLSAIMTTSFRQVLASAPSPLILRESALDLAIGRVAEAISVRGIYP